MANKIPSDSQWTDLSNRVKKAESYIPDLATLKSKMLDIVYPVGSIYMSVNNTSPQSFLGGTWVAWGAGRVPVGMGSNGTTNYTIVEAIGGEEKHTLTTEEMPSHRHQNLYTYNGEAIGTAGSATSTTGRGAIPNGNYGYGSIATGYEGGGTSHENRQPYITCYMWKRTK